LKNPFNNNKQKIYSRLDSDITQSTPEITLDTVRIDTENINTSDEHRESISIIQNPNEEQNTMLPMIEVMKVALIFCPVWFFANYTFNLSLSYTTVSSNTILSSTSGLFTLILGAITKTDKFTIMKLLSVALSFGGVVLVTLVDTNKSGTNSLFGDLLAIASAIGYAMYAILLKKKIPNEKISAYANVFWICRII